MTQFSFDLSGSGDEARLESDKRKDVKERGMSRRISSSSSVSTANQRRGFETAPFLTACALCKRRLGLDKDIYMYRGEIAFCSLECRQVQINVDERKAKSLLQSMKKESSSASGAEKTSINGETVVAA